MFKKKDIRRKYLLFVVIILTTLFVGCKESSRSHPAETDRTIKFTSYRDIPGVSSEEIAVVNALRKQYRSFIFGSIQSTETFHAEDGKIEGYSALLCEWLTKLFEIPFVPKIYEWGDILPGLESGAIDFSGDLTPTGERIKKNYYMTDAIANHMVSYFKISGSPSIPEIAARRPPRFVVYEGSATYNIAAPLIEFENYEIFFANDNAAVYEMLKSGKADAFLEDSYLIAGFDEYGDVVTENFLPLACAAISLTTLNPELKPVISIVQKALENGGSEYLADLYNQGQNNYMKHKLEMLLNDEEKKYIAENPVVQFAAQIDNYP